MAAARRLAQQPLQGGVQVAGQLFVVRLTRAGQCPYHNQATGGQEGQPITQKMTESALDLVADGCAPNGLADDETRTRGGNVFPRCVRVRCTAT